MGAAIAHEMNQPLAALRTLSDNAVTLIRRERAAEAEKNLGMIGQIVERMAQIATQLKTFARKPKGGIGPVSIGRALDHALTVVEPRLRAQRIEVRRPPEDAEALADGIRLEQVLVNLLGNAADALGGRDGGTVDVCVTSNAGRVTIAVRDNGPGIPTEVLPYLFEPFFTTRGPGAGLGLGLTICEGIVRDFGGTLRARNLPEEGGAEFTVELPAPAAVGGDPRA
jgi:two-component system C4-dicarboxylate transport sensor histidine kinase DctB